MAEAGSSEAGVVVRQTTDWRSAPSKSQPAQLVAQIYTLSQTCENLGEVGPFSFTFSPLSTHSSPSRVAVVLSPGAPFSSQFATPPGSENTKLASGSPLSTQKRLQEFLVFRLSCQIDRYQTQPGGE